MESDNKTDLGILIVRVILGIVLLIDGLNMVMHFCAGFSLTSLINDLKRNGIIYPEVISLLCVSSFIVVGIIVSLFIVIFLQWKNGLSVYTGGCEYTLIILSIFILLFLTGAGKYSLAKRK